MTLSSLLLLQAIVVGGMVLLTSALCDVEPSLAALADLRNRLPAVAPYLALLAGLWGLNRWSHAVGGLSSVALNITGELYAAEGDVVASVQALVPRWFAGYFTFVYLFGFAFLLVFPVVAYLFLPDRRHLEELLAAYALNYGGGAVCYVVFVARGPRKVLADVGAPMYELYPEVSSLTGAVNSATNVFPSLHASFAVTVALLAWRSRDAYPRWPWIASVLAANVLLATMVLGIHWLLDVVAGVVLAVLSSLVALRLVDATADDATGSAASV